MSNPWDHGTFTLLTLTLSLPVAHTGGIDGTVRRAPVVLLLPDVLPDHADPTGVPAYGGASTGTAASRGMAHLPSHARAGQHADGGADT